MKTSANLIKVKSLIEDPNCWLKRFRHRVLNNKDCYCMMGAVEEIAKRTAYKNKEKMQKALVTAILGTSDNLTKNVTPVIINYNDSRLISHEDVMRMLELAITEAKRNND